MIETVLTLPFVIILLLMILFYGWSMTRLQRASVQDRYEAWRQVYHGYGPRVTGHDPDDPDPYHGTEQINDAFWAGGADALRYDRGQAFPDDTRDQLKGLADQASEDAGLAAAYLLEEQLPHGRWMRFDTTHDTRSPLLEQLGGPIRHAHTRIGNEWKYANAVRLRDDDVWVADAPRVTPGDLVRDQFVLDLDRPLEPIANSSAHKVARVIRWYYRGFPGYVGPDVDYQFPVQE